MQKLKYESPVIQKMNAGLMNKYGTRTEYEPVKQIDGVLNVTKKGNKLSIKSSQDIREQISNMASSNNWVLLSMNIEENSLEDVFQQLTLK